MRARDTFRLAVLLLCCVAAPRLHAQAAAAAAASQDAQGGSSHQLDSVVAVVNKDVLLESDVEEEERFAAFQPFSAPTQGNPRQEALSRLIDRTLVEQQMKRQLGVPEITTAQVDAELTLLRKSLPDCAKYACTTDAGWSSFCAAHGFTPEQVEARWLERMTLLKFIEQRFKTGIRISEPEIEEYYNKTFVPRFRERNMTPPSLPAISDRIGEILLQQRVNVLLEDWLKSLHDQGSVQILDPSLVPASGADTRPAVTLPGATSGVKSIDGVPTE